MSDFTEEPERAASIVAELVEFGRKRVPREYWRETKIRLMATAGLRMLEKGVQDRILEACRTVLRGSGFRFYDDWASVISGMMPFGLWISFNFGSLICILKHVLYNQW